MPPTTERIPPLSRRRHARMDPDGDSKAAGCRRRGPRLIPNGTVVHGYLRAAEIDNRSPEVVTVRRIRPEHRIRPEYGLLVLAGGQQERVEFTEAFERRLLDTMA